MTNRYQEQKNYLILFIVVTLFVFISSVAFYIYEKEKTHIIENENIKIETEVKLLGEFLHNSILRRDYAQARNYLQSWVQQQKNIRNLEVRFENGASLFSYVKECKTQIFIKKDFSIGNKKYTIGIAHSIVEANKHIKELLILLSLLVILFTSLVGFALWFILSRWIVNPLQEEIDEKIKDISEQQNQLEHINRSYQALSGCNIALLEADIEQGLLDNICNIIYSKVGYKLVWIGYKVDNEEKNVEVMAYQGDYSGYLDEIDIRWSNSERGNGPTGRSIRERRSIVINNMQLDPHFKPWQESAKIKGFHSCAAIPILFGNKIFGAINVYSNKIDAFLEKELQLLNEMASNLAFGIVSLRQRKEVEKNSITDSLTEIYNRRYFDKKFQELIETSKRNNEIVSLLMLDVDHFKQYNDNYGHAKGDVVLQSVAGALNKATKRANDYCFRLGGEEFGVLFLSNSTSNAFFFAQSIKKHIDRLEIEHKYSDVSDYITVSIGLVSLEARKIESIEAMYQEADKLLYEAKEGGRDKIIANK